MTDKWKPAMGETYFINSVYASKPYEYVWRGEREDIGRAKMKTLYKTYEEALAAKQKDRDEYKRDIA